MDHSPTQLRSCSNRELVYAKSMWWAWLKKKMEITCDTAADALPRG
jgi:hypothetical protein